jgi:dGTPase
MKAIPNQELLDRFLATADALAHLKTKSSHRRHVYEVDFQAVGNQFVRDSSVILSSKASRRMGGKNQVASSHYTPHIRNRATHVGEVVAHSIRITEHLGLNTHLTQAIAQGHDIGHVPFGHQGEHYLQSMWNPKFSHEVFGVVIAQHIERRGTGLNLTHATLDGMWRHSGKNTSATMTQEAWVVRYADKIAYLFADYNDFQRLEWRCSPELEQMINWFGSSQRDRTFRTMVALCEESAQSGRVHFETSETAQMFDGLRKLMYAEYDRVVEQDVSRFLDPIYDFLERSKLIPPWLGIALLTDEEVSRLISNPHMLNSKVLMDTGLGEIIKKNNRDHLFAINGIDLDLNW